MKVEALPYVPRSQSADQTNLPSSSTKTTPRAKNSLSLKRIYLDILPKGDVFKVPEHIHYFEVNQCYGKCVIKGNKGDVWIYDPGSSGSIVLNDENATIENLTLPYNGAMLVSEGWRTEIKQLTLNSINYGDQVTIPKCVKKLTVGTLFDFATLRLPIGIQLAIDCQHACAKLEYYTP